MVSIIVPVYNVQGVLPKCIDSVLTQDCADWELILVDDGSTDQSGAICDEYSQNNERIRVVHSSNQGVSHARNIGLDISLGDIICFIDSDDWVESNYISSMLKYSDGDETIVLSGVVHDRKGKESFIEFKYKEGETYSLRQSSDFIVRNRIPGNGFPFAKFFRKRIIDQYKLRFDERISFHEDHLFYWQYLLYVKKIVLSGVAAYHYVHQDTGLSLSGKKYSSRAMILVSDALIPVWEKVIDKFEINNMAYIKSIYTEQGLRPLICAVQSMTADDIDVVGQAVRKRLGLFRKYYSPVHIYAKIIPILFFLRMERVFLLKSYLKR